MPLRLNDASIKVEKVFSPTPQNHVISIARNDSRVQLPSLKTFDILLQHRLTSFFLNFNIMDDLQECLQPYSV